MSNPFKILGQAAPAAATLTTLYTVPAGVQTACSCLLISNHNSGKIRFRISVAIGGAADTPAQYLFFDNLLSGTSTTTVEIGIPLSAGDVVRVQTDTTATSFNLFGIESAVSASTVKVLGQLIPTVNTLTALYTVPASVQASCSCLVVCNQTSGSAKIRIALAIGGAADSAQQYLFFDVSLGANASLMIALGIFLATTDVVRVQTDTANVSFNLFGNQA